LKQDVAARAATAGRQLRASRAGGSPSRTAACSPWGSEGADAAFEAGADKSAVWVVVPGFNEGPVIGKTLASVKAWLPNVVVVDDGSSDDTADRASRAGAHVLRHPINLGQGAALGTGIGYALLQQADFIITFDADGQHQPSDIDVLLRTAREHRADVVLGSRFLGRASDMPASRRLLLKLATAYTRFTTGLSLTDAHNGLRLFSRRAAKQLRIRQNRMAHASEMLEWLGSSGLRVVEAPVDIVYTDYSLAKGQTAWSSINILWDLWLGRLYQ
jgi:glycosyltransferase involved in cell wall biosynthesis